jgi:hypothetical protein
MMRRSALDRVGGFEEGFTGPLQLYEDQAFLAKLFVHGTVFFSDRVWLDYRLHDESCTATVNRAGLQPEVRHYFLNWFERYLTSTRFRHDPRVRWALFKALRPYRHPKIWAAGRTLKRSLQRRRPFATPIEAVAPDCG